MSGSGSAHLRREAGAAVSARYGGPADHSTAAACAHPEADRVTILTTFGPLATKVLGPGPDGRLAGLEGYGSAFIRRSSLGVLLGIMPWNYPYYQVARFAGPNLAIGNTILLKHAPQCPESAEAIEQITREDFGLPRRSGPGSPEEGLERARAWWEKHKGEYKD